MIHVFTECQVSLMVEACEELHLYTNQIRCIKLYAVQGGLMKE